MLSVVITTWNEEKNLPRVIASVDGLADEIIVVDTQSTDRTVEIAKKLGVKVYTHKYEGIVEPVRNFSISKARGDWILLLDADEEVSPGLAKHIRAAIKENAADYFRVPRYNLIFGKWIRSSHWWPDYVYRLFKKGFVIWDEAIHSIPSTRGQGLDFPQEVDYAIIHHHYENIPQYLERINRYTDHQLAQLLESRVEFSWTLLIEKPLQEFLTQYFSRSGFKDGIHGLALSGLQAFSEFVLYLKLWQSLGFVQKDLRIGEVNSEFDNQKRQYSWWYYQSQIDSSSPVKKSGLKILRKISTFRFSLPEPFATIRTLISRSRKSA